MVAVAVSELVATEERVSSARAAVLAASLREQGENRDTQTRHQGDCDRGGWLRAEHAGGLVGFRRSHKHRQGNLKNSNGEA